MGREGDVRVSVGFSGLHEVLLVSMGEGEEGVKGVSGLHSGFRGRACGFLSFLEVFGGVGSGKVREGFLVGSTPRATASASLHSAVLFSLAVNDVNTTLTIHSKFPKVD